MTPPAAAAARPPVVCTPLAAARTAVADLLPGVAVVHTGTGAARSARAAARLAAAGPRPVLVTGVARALSDRVDRGDVVVADEIRPADPDDPRAPVPVPTAAPLAAALRRRGLRVHVGPVVSAAGPLDDAARARLAAGGALAVDTEAAWLATAAGGTGGAPVAVVHAVTGPADADPTDADPTDPGPTDPGPTDPNSADPDPADRDPDPDPAALESLRRSAPALRSWLAALGVREVQLAEPRSFCAGVDRAIETVERALDRWGPPVYVRRQIVHNTHVVDRLAERGAVFVQEADEVPAGAVLVLAAHGVTPAVRASAAEQDRRVVDATCPLVTKVHAEVRRHAVRGSTVFLIGHAEHEEVEGTVGEAPERTVVVATEAEAETVTAPDPERVAFAVQTTLAVDEADRIAAVLRRRFPALAAPRSETICYATTNRQRAVRAVAAGSDLVVVLGSATSSNSVRLAEVAGREGVPAHRVEDTADLDLDTLAGVTRVGLSAGASAPGHLVDEVVAVLRGLGPVSVTTRSTAIEDVRFALPREVG